MGALDGRVAIITGAGRGIGREHALLFAAEGAKVVVNDLGGNADGTGGDKTPAEEVVHEIEKMGGEAVANGDNVASWEGGQRMVNSAIEAFGELDILVNNAGILRDRVLVNMTEEEWDAVVAVHLKGHFVPTRWAAAYWREQVKAGETVTANVVNTSSTSGLLSNPGQTNYGAAKSGIATFSADRGQGAVALRREGELHRAGRPHSAHRVDAGSRRDREGARRSRRVRHLGPREHLTARRLPRDRRLPVHRRDLLRAGRPGEADSSRGRWARVSSATSAGRSPVCRPSSASSQRRRRSANSHRRWGLT